MWAVTSDATPQVRVWRYGARKGVSIPPEVDEQLRLAHELREHLVELAFARERAIAAVWAAHSEVAKAERTVETTQAQLDKLLQRAAKERRNGRKRATESELREQIVEARRARREAIAMARKTKNEAYVTVGPALYEARDAERAARKAAYGEFVQSQGLYWATFNNVHRKHVLADRRVAVKRKQGLPAQLRHHRYDRTGRIAVQLQRESNKPERTAELLCTPASPWWGVLRLPEVAATDPEGWDGLSRAEQRRRGRASIAVRVYSREDGSPFLWEIPVQIHRPLSTGAEVLAAEVVITRVATERRVSVNLTTRTRAAPGRAGPIVAVDIGWRAMPDGSLRVGYWRASKRAAQPVRVPEHLAGVLHVDASRREGEIRIPASWRQLQRRAARIQSGRDKDLDRIKERTATQLKRHPQLAEALDLAPADVLRWRSPARMVSLGRRLEELGRAPKLREQIRAWARHDRRLWQWEANEREQLALRRRDAYRAIAALLTRTWPHVLLETRFVSDVTRRPRSEEIDTHQAEHARAAAKLAAPAELADVIRTAATSRGGTVTEIDPALTTRRHHTCQQAVQSETNTAASAMVECRHCGVAFDQDQNAAINMLREHQAVQHAMKHRSATGKQPAMRARQ